MVGVLGGSSVLTEDEDAHGIFAQSVGGGGGGDGGWSVAAALGLEDKQVNLFVSLAGSGGTAGEGDSVEVDNIGFIDTFGGNSHGILAQSIGLAFGRDGGGVGDGGAVTIASSGGIRT